MFDFSKNSSASSLTPPFSRLSPYTDSRLMEWILLQGNVNKLNESVLERREQSFHTARLLAHRFPCIVMEMFDLYWALHNPFSVSVCAKSKATLFLRFAAYTEHSQRYSVYCTSPSRCRCLIALISFLDLLFFSDGFI